MLSADDNEAVVRRFIDEVMNERRLTVIDEIATPSMARSARAWIEPFLGSFSDVRMEIVDLVAEDDKVVGRCRCSGTQTGDWRGNAPTGRRFERVDEVSFFRIRDGRIASAWGVSRTPPTASASSASRTIQPRTEPRGASAPRDPAPLGRTRAPGWRRRPHSTAGTRSARRTLAQS